MRLAVVYNVWDGEELLPISLRPWVELKRKTNLLIDIIAITQDRSWRGEVYEGGKRLVDYYHGCGVIDRVLHIRTDVPGLRGRNRRAAARIERKKRQMGIDLAVRIGATHVVSSDVDEVYWRDDIEYAIRSIRTEDYDRTYAPIRTYYREPYYRMDRLDNYYVPFISKLRVDQSTGVRTREARVDPTRGLGDGRRPKIFSEDDIIMHHYSYIRTDIGRKVRNSTAPINREDILQDYINARLGSEIKTYSDPPPRLELSYHHPYYSI